jgi:serine/threonine-protein kinase
MRTLTDPDAKPLGGTAGGRSPVFSPDGRWVAFFTGTELKKVSVNGGSAITLCQLGGAPRGLSWALDDTLVFATNSRPTGLLEVPAGGGEAKVITTADAAHGESDHWYPSVLPGGQAILYTVTTTLDGSPEGSQVAVFDRRTGRQKTLVRGASQPEYVEPGYLLYGVAGTIRAVRFDVSRLETVGDAVPVVEQITMGPGGSAEFAVSRDGALVSVPGSAATGGNRSIVWVDRQGRETPVNMPSRNFFFLRLSPDGSRAAFDIRDQERDIWIWDFARQTPTRLTFGAALDAAPVWTPDGRRIAYQSNRGDGVMNIYWQAADGSGTVERLTRSGNVQQPTGFSPDGSQLLFNETATKTGIDVRMMTLAPTRPAGGEPPAETLIQTSFQEGNAEISPDGKWVAYQSNDAGMLHVIVRPFPKTDGGRWQISPDGGSRPVWARNGRELFYIDTSGRLMAVPVRLAPSFEAGNPTKIVEGTFFNNISGRTYDVSSDGQRFLMIKEPTSADASAAPPNIVVVEHWIEEVKARVK